MRGWGLLAFIKIMIKELTLSIACLFLALTGQAAEVSLETAKLKAKEIMNARFASFNDAEATVTPVMYNGEKAYYVVQFAPKGWTLIAADDRTEPLIGFSDEGTFVVNDMPAPVKAVIDCFSRRVVDRTHHLSAKAAGWETQPSVATRSATRAAQTIAPLIPVKWNQGKPYNAYCPKDSKGQAIVGCVAVGMAQAMSVARWPERPTGKFSYTSEQFGYQSIDYDNEPAYDWNDIIAGNNNKDGAARLLWHCGVAVKMDYGINGSGTQTTYIVSALQRNFSYPKSVVYHDRNEYSDEEWHNLMYNELAEGRAIAFKGYDPKGGYGHCFNLDGYNNGAYHVNWGWGGSNDGYFELHALKDLTMGMDYSEAQYQGAVIGIRAPSDKPSDILLSNTEVKAEQPAGAVVGDIEVQTEATDNPTYTWQILGPYSLILHKRLPAPFEVKDGKLLTTDVLAFKDGDRPITITVTDNKGNSLSRDFTIKVLNSSGISGVENGNNCISTATYDLGGRKNAGVGDGVIIQTQKFADGSRKAKKILK